MRLIRAATIAAVLASLAPAATPRAAETGNEFLARLMGHLYSEGKSLACFRREYDDGYLASHPGQQIAFVKALFAAYYRQSPFGAAHGAFSYQVRLAFRLRGRPETFTQVAECGAGKSKDSLRDGADCAGPGDAGSHLALAGDRSVMLTIPGGADLWAPGPIDKRHDIVKNPFGPDDKVFRLDPTDLAQCEDQAFDAEKPLRPHEW